MTTLRERFEAKYIPGWPSECWIWTAALRGNGYGTIKVYGKMFSAHRVAYEIYVGPIDDGMHVCHTCDVRLCCNPAHLWIGTNADNMADRNAKGRQAHLQGAANSQAKLTEAEVLAIRAAPGTQKTIAAQFGITRSNVGLIKRRKRWAHL